MNIDRVCTYEGHNIISSVSSLCCESLGRHWSEESSRRRGPTFFESFRSGVASCAEKRPFIRYEHRYTVQAPYG